MNAIRRLQLTSAIAVFASGSLVASAPQGRGPDQTPPMYNVATEVTVSGTIEEVKAMQGPGGQGGIHLVLRTGAETRQIDVGPSWYLTQQKYALAKGDAVTVVGSRVTKAAGEAVIAREIKKGDQTMIFRDAKGFPKWSGRGRG